MLTFIDRVNISIAAKFIMPEDGLTDIQFGWIFSASVFGYALAQIPGNRFGPRRRPQPANCFSPQALA
ncbi:MAG: ACS family glucarate transporter-like MFS transporter [Gammaproteobacteria bacterium]|jgi:ACS family glucarate transporter-like MFS transporter